MSNTVVNIKDNTVINQPTIDMEAELKKIEGFSTLEALSYKKQIDQYRIKLKSCESLFRLSDKISNDDKLNKEILRANALDNADISLSSNELEMNYDELLDALETIANAIIEKVKNGSDKMESTSYLTQEMLKLLDSKANSIKEGDTNYSFNIRRINKTREAFENRGSLEFLTNNLNIYLANNTTNIVKSFKINKEGIANNTEIYCIKELNRYLGNNIVFSTQKILQLLGGIDVTFVLLQFIERNLSRSKKGENIWGKLLCMNLGDIDTGIFDIGDVTDYLEYLKYNLINPVDMFLKENGITLGDIKTTQFGAVSGRTSNILDEIEENEKYISEVKDSAHITDMVSGFTDMLDNMSALLDDPEEA